MCSALTFRVFTVGGTNGIGEATAKAFIKNTVSPRVYLVGRSSEAAERIITECKALNKDGNVEFIKADVSELRDVDRVCKEIESREKSINLIVQTQGNLNMRNRDGVWALSLSSMIPTLIDTFAESAEGLDRKMSLNYYSRMRFIHNLLPLLKNASTTTPNFSRSLSVLAPGGGGKINLDDMDLKNTFSGPKCAAYTTLYNDFMVGEWAARAPGTTFEHTFPSIVKTGIMRELPLWVRVTAKAFSPLISLFSVSLEETGARQLFHATSGIYKPFKSASDSALSAGIPFSKELGVAEGSDGKEGSGAYLVNWNGDIVQPKGFQKEYRQQGYSKMIWEHTMAVFERVEKLNGNKAV